MFKKNIDVKKSLYVIDKDYHLVYLDEGIKRSFPEAKAGDFCYQIFGRVDSPCQNCPLKPGKGEVQFLYNKFLRQRFQIQLSYLEWPGAGECALIIAREFEGGEPGYQEQIWEKDCRDSLTGLYIRSCFCEKAQELLAQKKIGPGWILASIDIEHFKLFNEWYGQEAGDKCLSQIAEHLQYLEKETGGLAGYLWDDDFVVLLPDEGYLFPMQSYIMGIVEKFGEGVGFYPAIGVYRIEETETPVSIMCDRASVALETVKGSYGTRISYFEPGMIRHMEEEHRLLVDAQNGFADGDFIFYLQPKCNLENGKVVGAEALVRWKHKTKGILPPGAFLPLFEKNGFISTLDNYIWEEVCRWLRQWIDRGNPAIPISVNVSRMDVYSMDVPAKFKSLIRKYKLSPRMLDIEITESAYMEQFSVINRVVEELRSAGFHVLMDDFGSGFSSLNMLKDIKLDVLKIDMKFLQLDQENQNRGRKILKTVNNMAQIMEMRVIAEGVETDEQKQLLMDMGLGYGQGYYFYYPLSTEEFEQIFSDGEKLDYVGFRAGKKEKNVRERGIAEYLGCTTEELKEIISISEHMEEMPGALLKYEATGRQEISYVNRGFLRLLGYTGEQFEKKFHNRFPELIYKEDRERVQKEIKEQTLRQESCFSEYRIPMADGNLRWFCSKGRLVKDTSGKPWIYAVLMDIHSYKQQMLWQQKKYRMMAEIPGSIFYDYEPETDCLHIDLSMENGERQVIETKDFLNRIYYHDWLSYDTAGEHQKVFEKALSGPMTGTVDFRGRFFGEEFRWYRSYFSSVANEKGEVYHIVGRADDIQDDKEQLQKWQTRAQRDAMTQLLNHDAANHQIDEAIVKYGGGVLILIDIDDFKKVNDILGHYYGDQFLRHVAAVIRELFRRNDILGRFGGDEFIIFLPGVRSGVLAKNRAKDILDAIGKIRVPRVGSVGCSIGISIADNDAVKREDLFKKADQALYQAKRNGKGFYILHGE